MQTEKQMANYNPSALAALAQKEIGAKPRRALHAAEQYKQAVYDEIIYGYYVLATTDQINNNTIPFSINRVRKRLGRYSSKNLYWWDWLHRANPLVKIIKKGNSIQGAVSMAQPEIPLEIILKSGDAKQVVKALYSAHDLNSELHFAPINVYSLENYVLSTSRELELNPLNSTYKQNLQHAQTILMIAKECNNQLPQIVNHSAFGRTYYRGINLQNVHKTVRHAALGSCYSVDIDSAVFNWKYAIMSKDTQQALTYTRELIQDKHRLRKQLAQLVFDNASERSIKTIKQVLTAISFGAKESGKGYYYNKHWTPTNGEPKYITSSIDIIIKSPESRKRLFRDPWMKKFMDEQKTINDCIYKSLVQQLTSGEISEDKIKELRSRANRISPAKFIAWAYQHSEQYIMKQILEWSRAEPLLQVHDGVYFKTKPDMPSMQTVLQDNWPLATLSIEQIDNYHYVNRDCVQDHLDHIRAEEITANNGADPRTTGIHSEKVAMKQYNPHTEPDWESEMIGEYMQSIPKQHPEFIQQILQGTQQ
jgi:hypothetical protein